MQRDTLLHDWISLSRDNFVKVRMCEWNGKMLSLTDTYRFLLTFSLAVNEDLPSAEPPKPLPVSVSRLHKCFCKHAFPCLSCVASSLKWHKRGQHPLPSSTFSLHRQSSQHRDWDSSCASEVTKPLRWFGQLGGGLGTLANGPLLA